MPNKIAYTVTCTIQYKTLEEEWLDWLKTDHIPEVLKAGASSATLIKRDPETIAEVTRTYEIRYEFEDRRTFETYQETHAPRLQRESLTRFPVADGFHYKRTVGEILNIS